MSKKGNSNKGWGGPFDFNWDGKTTWDEVSFGLMLAEQCRKNDDLSSCEPPRKTRATNEIIPPFPVPEKVDESNYTALIDDYRSECIGAIVAVVVFLLPAIFILWAVFNSENSFLIVIFSIAGLIYGGTILGTAGKHISICLENIALVKERYSGNVPQKTKQTK